MANKVLILTTGGSSEPLVTSIKGHRPDYVIFLCSSDQPNGQPGSYKTVDYEGKPCKERDGDKPSIVSRTGLTKEQYEVKIIDNIDSLFDCYEFSRQIIEYAHKAFPRARVLADYTGGTKSMSAGLVLAALDDENTEIFLVAGERRDLIKVRRGTQHISRGSWQEVILDRRMRLLEKLFAEFNYPACLEVIQETSPVVEVGSKHYYKLQSYAGLTRAFLAWDQFRHEDAYEDLKYYAAQFTKHKVFLDRIIKLKKNYAERQNPERVRVDFALVHDILRNAERRLLLKQYDEAVARTYRALELIAQLCLYFNKPSIDTSKVDIALLPKEIQDKYRQMHSENVNHETINTDTTPLQLPMFKAYVLLDELGHPVGQLFREKEKRLLDLIRMRNFSIFAHGLDPIDADKAKEFYEFTVDFLLAIEKKLELKQNYDMSPNFPQNFPEPPVD